jgi:RimJ/RimL family protein N-acetyltransferase
MNSKDLIFLEGDTIYLRSLLESDVEGNYIKWLNDQEVVQFNSHGRFPFTKEKLLEYVRLVTHSNEILVFAIIDIKTDRHIGNISLQSINWIDRNAEIAFILGEKDFWSKGIMYEAGTILLKHAFTVLNLHRVYCGTSSENIGMQKLAIKLGMKKEGDRIDAIFKNGNYYSIYEYGIINKIKL